ncbi:unnamed protein product [Amoebophrya sp. A25]|nr:unnamed protein product [Amoebophrya sp. A25]|eukprot:GSA25T00005301001.1
MTEFSLSEVRKGQRLRDKKTLCGKTLKTSVNRGLQSVQNHHEPDGLVASQGPRRAKSLEDRLDERQLIFCNQHDKDHNTLEEKHVSPSWRFCSPSNFKAEGGCEEMV